MFVSVFAWSTRAALTKVKAMGNLDRSTRPAGQGQTCPFIRLREVIDRLVQMARHFGYVGLGPAQVGRGLPTPHLRLEAVPIPRLLVRAPVHLGGMAFDAVRGVEELAPGRWRHGLGNGRPCRGQRTE